MLVVTTWVGHRRAGELGDLRAFFLGGRRLPWYAVSASIVATEISAVTFVSLPSVVYREGGDLTYLQLVLIGSLFARAFVGFVLVPAYYEREIYSPYDYVGARLGEGARRATTLLFALGGVLAQSARVFVTALVLEVLLARELLWVDAHWGIPPLVGAVAAIGVVSVAWTWMGGIATVVWTDAILFLLFFLGAGAALATAAAGVEGGLAGMLERGWEAGKLRLFDAAPDLTKPFTLWAALLGVSIGFVGPYGTDQLMAQRLFCCRDARAARRAILGSYVAGLVVAAVALVGVGLWDYYRAHPLEGAARAAIEARPDRVFPVFITTVLPAGLKGLVVAGVFAAAISSLDSILAALSQTTLALFSRPAADDAAASRRAVRASRALVLGWGVVLCGAAVAVESAAAHYDSVLDLALAMASYTGGALLAAFFLAFLPTRVDGSGFVWSAPLSVLAVFAVAWHAEWAQRACGILGGVLLVLWTLLRALPDARGGAAARAVVQWLSLAGACAGIVATARWGTIGGAPLAWPWYVPIGALVAFGLGIGLARRATGTSRVASRARSLSSTVAVLLLLLGCAPEPPRAAPRPTCRAIWITRWDTLTADDVRRAVRECADAGFDTLLFQVRGNATVSFRSSYEPWAEQSGWRDPGFDPLALAIEEAHAAGLALHAWVNVMPAWWGAEPPANREHLYHRRPEWFWYDQEGARQPLARDFYVSVNPCLPEVRAYLVELLAELAREYPIDGLHLDYVRFPNEPPAAPRPGLDYPRDAATLALFRAATGLAPEDDAARWDAWRAEQVTELVRALRARLSAERPRALLSAAVGPTPELAAHHHQDYVRWLGEGLLDLVFPMNYSADPAAFAQRIQVWKELGRGRRVVMGVRCRHAPIDVRLDQLRAALEAFGSVCVFGYAELFDSRNTVLEAQDAAARAARAQLRARFLPGLRAAFESMQGG